MKLMKMNEWREKAFEKNSRPTARTVRNWIDKGHIPGQRIGTHYYVDLERMKRTGNPLVDKVLAA